MMFLEFKEICKEIGLKETKTITVLKERHGVPADTYILNELYCSDSSCDCRRVMFSIYSVNTKKDLATVAWGWESKAFYNEWIGGYIDSDMLDELKGPALNPGSLQCEFADGLLELVKEVLANPLFTQRIKEHYIKTRKNFDDKNKENKQEEILKEKEEQEEQEFNYFKRPGRNEPCFCGSGKKYKKCCLWA